jgi:hypothetical protein
MNAERFTNQAATTVSSGGTTAPAQGTSETWTVASSASFPPASTGVNRFHVVDPASSVTAAEIIEVTNVSGATWTVTRGAEGTTPVAHSSGFTVQQVITALSLSAFAQAGQGDLGGTGDVPTVAKIGGAVTSGQYARGNGSAVALSAIQAGDVPTLNQNTTGTAANVTATLDQIPAPGANVSLNSKKVTNLANGTAATDGAAFGQIPVVDSTAANILTDGSQAAGGNNKWADSGHVHPIANGTWVASSGSSGWLGWNHDPAYGSGGGLAVAGTVYLQRLNFYQATTITNLWYWLSTLGAGANTNQSFVGLYSSSGSLLTGSSDVLNKFNASGTTGPTQCPLTTPQSFTAGQFCWAACLFNLGTTSPTLWRSVSTALIANGGLTAANFRWGIPQGGTLQTSLPASFTPSSNGTTSFTYIVAWS